MEFILHNNDYFAKKFNYFCQVEAYLHKLGNCRKIFRFTRGNRHAETDTRKARYIGYFGRKYGFWALETRRVFYSYICFDHWFDKLCTQPFHYTSKD